MRVRNSLAGALAGLLLASAIAAAPALAAEDCSAAGMGAQTQDQEGLTAKADDLRSSIRQAAVNCRFRRLQRLALAGSGEFTYSFGESGSPARYWRNEEAAGRKVLSKLVKILDTPYVEIEQVYNGYDGKPTFVWPSAMKENPTDGDWQALRKIYTRRQIRGFKRHGYTGHRVFITHGGDWTVFVAGD